MKKFSQKQTEIEDYPVNNAKDTTKVTPDVPITVYEGTAKVNHFEGMAENMERIEPVFIKGYPNYG